MKAGDGTGVGVLHSYLLYNVQSKASNIRGLSRALDNSSLDSLPANMEVVIIDDDDDVEQHRTVIGVLNTRTGEFKDLRHEKRSFDLKGRKVGEGRKAMGVYVETKRLKVE